MLGLGLDTPGTWLLPRPFSIGWRSERGLIGILLRVFGRGTRALSALTPGETALVLGPLGTEFEAAEGRTTECVAGGVGLAPFVFLAAEEIAAGRPVRLVYGERDAEAVFDTDLLRELTDIDAEVFTEDGSRGTRGRVTAGLDPAADSVLCACGPTPMLAALARFAVEHDRDLQVSVEEHMGCGIGTCQGCVVRSSAGRWVKACVEGPVFRATDLDWGAP
ncbi:MAG: dihydroorotate dehydrogenase electron transfer subunit [Gemmatimonadota bacterium]|nr:dihydroorotate dehydrogenase electron transfer subunit [Gemmatimonadota bacterium]